MSETDTIALGVSLSLDGLGVEGRWLRSSAGQVVRFRPLTTRLVEHVGARQGR